MSSVNPKEPIQQERLTNAQLAERYSQNNFKINKFKYPSDLETGDLLHFVQFNILVRGKSTIRLTNEQVGPRVGRSPDTAQLSEEQLGAASTIGLAAGGAAAGVVVQKFVSELFSKNNKTGSTAKQSLLRKAVPGLIGGAAGVAASYSQLLKPDTTFRISDAIALYVDGPPTVRYNAQYSNKDLGTIAGLAGGGVSGLASMETGAALLTKFAQIPQIAGVNTADIVGASARVALNPFKEVLFEAIDFRAFNFKYRFFPKSREEANAVEEIIKRFKFHMHPELSTNKLFFLYPSEFEIAYYFQNNQNTYFHKFKPCVLESMDVSYGGEQFSSFSDGKPTEINMTLTFRETEILTKEQIKQGY